MDENLYNYYIYLSVFKAKCDLLAKTLIFEEKYLHLKK